MKNMILKPGTYDLAQKGKKQPGGDVGRFVLDILVNKGLLATTDCCNYTVVGGGGGGVTTNILSYNPSTKTLSSTVEGVAASTLITITAPDVPITSAITVNGTVIPAGTSVENVLIALAAVSHPAAVVTNTNAAFNWNASTQTLNIPLAASLVDNADGTFTFTKGDGSAPVIFNARDTAGQVVTTSAIVVAGTAYPIGTDVQTILGAIPASAGGHVPVTTNDSGTIDFTQSGTDNQTITATLVGAATATIDQVPTSDGAGNIIWADPNVVSASNGLHMDGQIAKLGGVLTEDTTIDGVSTFGTEFKDVTFFRVNTVSPVGTATTLFQATVAASVPAQLTVSAVADPANFARLRVDADGPLTALEQFSATGDIAGVYVPSAKAARLRSNVGGVIRAFEVNENGHFINDLPAVTSETEVVYIDPTSGHLAKGPAAGGVLKYAAGNGAIVTATGSGVTFTRTTASVWTFNIPAGVELLSFVINSTISESSTSALDIDFVYASSSFNQDISADLTDVYPPNITTLKKVSPAQFPTTAASNNPSWTIDVTAPGTLRMSTAEFSEVSGTGSVATMVKGVF